VIPYSLIHTWYYNSCTWGRKVPLEDHLLCQTIQQNHTVYMLLYYLILIPSSEKIHGVHHLKLLIVYHLIWISWKDSTLKIWAIQAHWEIGLFHKTDYFPTSANEMLSHDVTWHLNCWKHKLRVRLTSQMDTDHMNTSSRQCSSYPYIFTSLTHSHIGLE